MTKNFFYTVLLSIVNILFPIVSFPYASRILGPPGIGKVQFIVSLAQYFALFAALGIPIYGITQTAKYKDDPGKLDIVFVELTGIYFFASMILFIVYLIVIFAFPFFAHDLRLYLYAGILVLLSFCYTDWFYAGIEKFKIITIRSVIVKMVSLVLLFLFVRTENDFTQYLFIIIFSILGNQVFSFLLIAGKMQFRFADLNFRKHLVPLLFIFGATFASSIYTVFDTVLLGFLSDDTAVGLYTASVKLIKLTIPFVTAMGVILMPAIAKHFASDNIPEVKKLLDHSFNFLVFLSVPVCIGMALLAPELITVFSGSRFSAAATSMEILSLLPLLVGFGHFFSYQVLIPVGKNKEVFLSMLIGMFFSLLLNFILVPLLRETGAAIANVVTEFIVTLLYFYFIRKHYSFTHNWKFLFESVACVLPFIPIVIFIRHIGLNPVFDLLFSILSCLAVYLAIQLLVFRNSFLFSLIQPFKSKIRMSKMQDF